MKISPETRGKLVYLKGNILDFLESVGNEATDEQVYSLLDAIFEFKMQLRKDSGQTTAVQISLKPELQPVPEGMTKEDLIKMLEQK